MHGAGTEQLNADKGRWKERPLAGRRHTTGVIINDNSVMILMIHFPTQFIVNF